MANLSQKDRVIVAQHLLSNSLDHLRKSTLFKHFRVLSRLVIEKASDVNTWSAVINIIARTRPAQSMTTLPPFGPALPSTLQQTPHSFNSGSFVDTFEQRMQVNDALKEELLPSLRLDILPLSTPCSDGSHDPMIWLRRFFKNVRTDTHLYTLWTRAGLNGLQMPGSTSY